jgi:hypothetical protein
MAMTEEQFDITYTDTFDKLLGMKIARWVVRDLLLVAAALGHKARKDVEVTFTREYGYVVMKDGEIV